MSINAKNFLPLLGAALIVGAVAFPSRVGAAPDESLSTSGHRRIYTPEELEKAGWKLPRPPYPYAAMAKHEQGKVFVELTTDETGKVTKAETAKISKLPELEAMVASFAVSNWHGPPKAKTLTYCLFRLQ